MLILVAGTFLFFSIFAVLLPSSGVVLGEELPPVPWDRVEGDGETPKETGRLLQARSASASSRPHGTISSAFNVTDSFPPTFSGGTAVVHVEGDLEGVAPDSRTDCGPSAFRGGVWYTIRLPESRNPLAVSVDTCTNTTIDTVMGVVSGSDCPSNSSACECKWNDDACGIQSRVQLTERGGSDLFVTVGPYGALGDVTGFTLSFSLSELCEVPANTTRLDISGLDPRLVRSSNAAVTVREQTPVRVHLQCPQGDVCMYRNNEEEFWRYDGQCFIDLQCVSGLKIATAGRRPKCTAPNRADTIANATDLSDHFPLFVQEAGCATSFFGDWQNSTGDADFVDCGGSTSTGGVWHNSACRIRMVLSECTSTRTLADTVIGVFSGAGCPFDASACECKGWDDNSRRNQSRVSFVEGQEGSRASSWVFALVRPSVSEVKDSQFNLSVTLSAAHSSNRIEDAANFGEHTLTAFPEEDLSISVTGDWEGATGDWDFRHCGGSASMPGVWHKLRLPESRGNLSVSVESRSDTQSNTAVGILSGDGCPSNRSACVCKAWDEEGDGHLSRVSFLGSGGSEAFVLVRPSENSDGEGFNLTASIAQTASRPTRLISQGARHSLTVDDQGGLFVFGDNRNGQLGLEGWGTFRLPTRVRQVSGVVDACGGGEFSLALLRNGTVLSWGENSYGQLDRGNETDWRRPGTVQGLQNEKVVGVACGRLHGAGWTEGGKIFTWGLDWNGRLGLSHTPARGRQMQRRDAPTTSFQTRTTFETITPDVCRGRSIPEGSDDGENRRTASLVNAPISEGEAVAGVSLGEAHTLIVTRSGRAFGWGWNCNGQLGNGQSGEDAEENSPVEIVVGEEERIVAVSAGGSHSLVLTASQNVFAFGRNFEGQVGVERAGRTVATPHLLENLPGRVVEIAAGENFSFLRLEDGRVLSFGENGEGQLGLGHTDSQREPRLVDGLRAARLWKGGAKTFTSLLVATGGVQGAGKNSDGQLGRGGGNGRASTVELSFTPVLALDVDECEVLTGHCDSRATCTNTVSSFVCECPVGFSSSGSGTLCIGRLSFVAQGGRHSLTVDDQGDLFVFGDNRNGQLGLEGGGSFRLPTRVRQVSGVVDACGGGEFSLALLRNGTVLSWGENSYGQLGRGNETDWRRPGAVQGLQNEKVVGVACGHLHGAAWTEQGSIFVWGPEWSGRLSLNRTTAERQQTTAERQQIRYEQVPVTRPVVTNPDGTVVETRTTFETRRIHRCEGMSNPESRAQVNRRIASRVRVPDLEGEVVVGVSLGEAHTLIVTRSGRAFGWGWNCNGQLGNGQSGEDAEENSPVEIVVGEEERIVAVSAGGSHSLVLTASQNVFAFGRNFEGQVGVERAGRTVATPHLLENLPGRVVEIAAGENFSFLRLEDGRVLSFGENGEGQLGLGHTDSQREPRLVDGLRAARLWKGGAKTFTSLLVATGGVQGAGESSVGGKAYMGLTGSGSNEQGQLGLGSSGRLTNSELSIAPLFVTFWCPPAVSFPTDPGASSWRSSRGSFAAFFPSPFSSLSIDPEEPEEGVATGRTQVTFVPPVDSRVFDFGRSQKIRASLADQLSEQNAMMCDFPANVIDTEPPLPVCPSLLRLNVSRDARDISVLSLLEAPQVRDNVGLPAEVSLHYTFPAFPHSLPTIADLHSHFQSEDILSVLVEGTDKSGNTGSCTFVITSNRCPLNADRLSADSPCLCLPGYYSGKSQSGGLVCLQCDQNSHSRMGSLSPADCLYDSGYYRDATVPDESRCRPCIQRSNSSVGTNSPSECFCAEGSYFVPAEIRNSEGAAAVSLIDIVLHSDPFSLFTSGSCEPCPSNSTCRGQLLSDFEVSRVIRESRLAATLGHFREGRRGLGERNWTSRRHPLSPFRLLEAQSFETVQRTLRGLIAHPRPVPDGNFTLVQRWPHALIAPCPYQDTCSPGVQTDYQNDTAGTVCVSGHTGPMCNECEAGWRLNRQDLQCVECPPSEAISFLVAAMLLLAMPVAVWLFTAAVSKDNPHLAAVEHAVAMKIVLAFIGRFKMLSDLAAFALQRLREEALEHGLRERGGVMAGGVAWVAMSATRILKRLRSLPSIGSVFHLDYFFFRVFPESDLVSRNLLTLTVPATILLLLAIFGLLAVFVGFCRSRKTTRKMERTASHRRNEKDGKPNNGEEERKGRCPTVLQDAVEEEGEEGREKGERTEGVSGQTDIGAANRETLVLKRNRMRAFFFKRFVGVFRCNFDESTSCWSVLTAWFEGLVALSLAIMVIWGESLVGIPVATLRCIFLHPDMPTETGLRLHIQASQQCPRGVELLFAGAFWLSCAFAVFLPIIFLAAVTCRKRALLEATGGGGNGKSQKKSPGGWCVRSLGTRNSHRSRFSWRAATATRPPPREDSFSIQNESGERGDGAERGNSILKESKESPPQSMSSAQTDLAATHASVVTGDPRALHALFQWQLSVLLVGYKEEFYYWELVIFLRRFSLPLVLLEGESLATLYILGVHAVLFLLLQSLVRPYKTATLNRLETLSLGCWLLAVLVFQFLVNPNVALITKLTLLCVFVGVSASFIVYALSAILGGFLAGAVAALKSAYGRVVSPEDGCLPAFLIPLLQKYRVFTVLLCLLEPLAVACRQRSKVLICLDENDGRGDREKGRDSAILRRAETREAEGDSCCFVCFEKRRCCRRRSPKTCGARTDLESKDLRLSGGASMGEIVAAASPLFAQTWKGVHSEVSRIEMSLLNAMAENRRKSSALSCPSETEEALECSTLEPPPLATGFTLRAARLLNRWVGPGTSVGGSASHKLLSVHVCQLPVELCVLLKQILCCREQAEEQRRKALEPDVGRTSTKLSGREEEDEGPRAVQTDLKRNTELASTLQRNHADTPRNATVGFRNFVHSPRAEGKEVCSGFEGVADDGAASELPEEGPREDVAVYAPVLRGPVGSESDEQGINVGAERPTENGEEELEHVLQGEKGSDGVFGGSPEAFLRPQKRPLQLTDEVVSPSRDAFGVEGGIDLARPAAPPSVTAKHSASKLPVSCLPRISTAKDQESPFESDLSVVLWTEKDAIIAENRLWKGLLEVCTNLPESSSMEGFLEKDGTGQKGEERETLNRMIRLSEGFFVSSNALERGEWSGLSLQQLQEGVALLRHLQPELLLQLYFSYLASAYDRMHKKTK